MTKYRHSKQVLGDHLFNSLMQSLSALYYCSERRIEELEMLLSQFREIPGLPNIRKKLKGESKGIWLVEAFEDLLVELQTAANFMEFLMEFNVKLGGKEIDLLLEIDGVPVFVEVARARPCADEREEDEGWTYLRHCIKQIPTPITIYITASSWFKMDIQTAKQLFNWLETEISNLHGCSQCELQFKQPSIEHPLVEVAIKYRDQGPENAILGGWSTTFGPVPLNQALRRLENKIEEEARQLSTALRKGGPLSQAKTLVFIKLETEQLADPDLKQPIWKALNTGTFHNSRELSGVVIQGFWKACGEKASHLFVNRISNRPLQPHIERLIWEHLQ